MKLYCHKISTTSRPVLMFISENKIPCDVEIVDLFTGAHHQEPFISLNPSRQVPVLDDDGFVLTESSTILKYLAEKTNSPLYPKDLKQRARVNEAMDWLNTGFYRELGYHLVYPQVYPHHVRKPEDANKVTVDWGKGQAEFWLGVLDSHWLGKGNKYLTGNDMTIADYFGAGLTSSGEIVSINFGKYPNVKKWLDGMKSSLKSWGDVSDVHDGFVASLKDKQLVSIA